MVDFTNEVGTWQVVTATSVYFLDCEAKLAKRVPRDSSLEGYEKSSLRKDNLWFKFKFASAEEGMSMRILASDINDADDIYTLRITTPVMKIGRVV